MEDDGDFSALRRITYGLEAAPQVRRKSVNIAPSCLHLLDESGVRSGVRPFVAQEVERLFEAPTISEHKVRGYTGYTSASAIKRVHKNAVPLSRSLVNEVRDLADKGMVFVRRRGE